MQDVSVGEYLRNMIGEWLEEAGRDLTSRLPDQERLVAEIKGHGDFVTATERQIEETLRENITHTASNFPVIAEESFEGGTPDLSGPCWVIDPLDATSGFLFQAGRFIPSIMMAFCIDGQPEVSGIHFPLAHFTVTAHRGHGLKLHGATRLWTTAISVARASVDLSEAWVDVNRYSDIEYQSELVRRLDCTLRSTQGAALVTSLVPHSGIVWSMITGEPNISAVVHDNNSAKVKQAVWDVLPAQLILTEAGGFMIDLNTGQNYDPCCPGPFVAAVSASLAFQIFGLTL
ncbi:MAG: inositol monophosphatase family protein [bacterium]|nr:inositol monophosphatase family protein [bacterium]